MPVDDISLATRLTIGVGVGAGASTSTVSSVSSTQGFWALINQYQLYLLFPYMQTYMPSDLEYYLTEFQIFSIDFSFLELFEIPYIEHLAFKLDYDQTDTTFANNGFSSGSFLINHWNMFKALLIVLIFNLIFVALYYIFTKCRTGGKCKKVTDKLIEFFYLATYIRVIIEAATFAFMSSCLEITSSEASKHHTFSYIYSLIFTGVMMIVPIFVFIHYKKMNEDWAISETSLFKEFYEGTKDKRIAKLFIVVFFIRRYLTIMILVFMRNTHAIPRCALFCIVQLLNLAYLIKAKPFENTKDNIIEIMNECIF